MDFLKGLFSSKKEDQSLNDITSSSSPEPTPEEPQASENGENTGRMNDSNFQE